jgi:hypothetical protein
MLGNRPVIGLDYGTTYTGECSAHAYYIASGDSLGVSFCETTDVGVLGKDIEVVKD